MTNKPLAIKPIDEVKDDGLETHFSDGVVKHYSKDEIIIDGSIGPQGVYLIKKGFVKAYTITKAGQVNLMLIHNKGKFIPLIWALDGVHTEG